MNLALLPRNHSFLGCSSWEVISYIVESFKNEVSETKDMSVSISWQICHSRADDWVLPPYFTLESRQCVCYNPNQGHVRWMLLGDYFAFTSHPPVIQIWQLWSSGFPPGKSLLKPSKAVGRVYCASLVTEMVKNLPEMQEIQVQSPGWKDPLEDGMATHSSILAWRSPCTEEPGGLQPMVSQRVRHGWAATKHVDTYFERLCYYPSRQMSVYTNALFNILSITLVVTSATNSSY